MQVLPSSRRCSLPTRASPMYLSVGIRQAWLSAAMAAEIPDDKDGRVSGTSSVACAKASMESLQRLRPGVTRTPAWTGNEDPVLRWEGSSSATGSSIEPQTTLHVFHLERRPALTRQADEHHHWLWHHRPEQESANGSASSSPRGAPVTAQLCFFTRACTCATMTACVASSIWSPQRAPSRLRGEAITAMRSSRIGFRPALQLLTAASCQIQKTSFSAYARSRSSIDSRPPGAAREHLQRNRMPCPSQVSAFCSEAGCWERLFPEP